MSYRLVEAYGTGEATVEVQGRTYADPSLIEDDEGLRWYLASTFIIAPGHWASALAHGVVALLGPAGDGPEWEAVTTEDFARLRVEQNGLYHLVDRGALFDQPPAYRDLLDLPSAPALPGGFVHLHTHSEYSEFDGCSRHPELVREIVADGQTAAALTDHGTCAGHPEWQRECTKAGVKPIFGIEANFVHDRLRRPEEWWVTKTGLKIDAAARDAMTVAERKDLERVTDVEAVTDYYHLVLLAQTQQGLLNIWGASTESERDGFYGRPRMDWETLQHHSEGVIATTGCLRGPVAKHLLDGDVEAAVMNLGRLMEIFGDRLYVEIHANSLPEQTLINETLVSLAQQYSLPLVAVVDSHYPKDTDYDRHQVWIAASTSKTVDEEKGVFAGNIGLHMKTEAEVRESLSYLPDSVVDEAIANTVVIAEQCNATIVQKRVVPVYSKKGGADRDVERLIDLCLENWDLTIGPGKPSQEKYIARFEQEMALLIPKGFCGYYLQVADYVTWAKANRIRVGPGRGSGGGSLVAFLARITGLDSVEHDLPFERFMTEGRTALPDFDVDFPASKRDEVQDYVSGKYGEEHVIRIGTHTRVKNKGVFKDVFRALKERLPDDTWRDQEAIAAIIDSAEASTAGLGLSWDDLWAQEGELLEPYQAKYPEPFRFAEQLVGTLRSYGKHPAGVIASEERLVDSLPLRRGEGLQMVGQFSMNDLEAMGYVKWDILTLRTLDTIQEALDLIFERRGIEIDPDQWKEEYFDPQVWETIGDGHTLGVFQVETASGVRMCKQVRPANLAEFADVLTLVRPGPMRSGLTQLYLDRRAGISEVSVPDARLSEVLAPTQGCILYQEQVMQTCMLLAGYGSDKADEVRKILGKKQVEKVVSAGNEFVEKAVEHGMERMAAEHLWEQLAEFAKYSFGKAHAFGYAVLAYWTAWLKVHYPIEMYTALLSTVHQNRIPEFISEARRFGFQVLPPDVNQSGRGFSAIQLGVRYGLDSLKGVGDSALETIIPAQPFTSFDDFRERSGAKSDVAMTLVRIGAFDSLGENRRGLEALLEGEKAGTTTQCTFKDPEAGTGPQGVCTFDWESEPAPVNPRTNRTLKKKSVPKKCMKSCRQYTAPPPFDPTAVSPYDAGDVRDIEMEILGIHLSSTVFDRLDDVDRQRCLADAERMEDGPEGNYTLAVTVSKVRKHTDRNGNDMGFLGFVTERSDLDVTCFKGMWAQISDRIKVGAFAFVEVYKNDRGLSLTSMLIID